MRTTRTNTRNWPWGAAGALAAICGFLIMSGVSAQSPFQVLQAPGDKPPPPKEVKEVKPASDKLITFTVAGLPWPKVFEWLSDQTGMQVLFAPGVKDPGGLDSASIITPKGRQYTLPQLIDVLNEALIVQKHIMIRRDTSFVIYPADKRIPGFDVPHHPSAQLQTEDRKVVIIFSDGYNIGSQTKRSEIVQRSMNSNITVYGLGSSPVKGLWEKPAKDPAPDLVSESVARSMPPNVAPTPTNSENTWDTADIPIMSILLGLGEEAKKPIFKSSLQYFARYSGGHLFPEVGQGYGAAGPELDRHGDSQPVRIGLLSQ